MRQKRLLFILLAILALSAVYALWATPRSRTRDEKVASRPGTSTTAQGQKQRGADWQSLRIDLLEPEKREYPGFKRDIFGPLFPRPKVVRKPPPPPKKIVEPVAPKPPEPPPVVHEEVREALARFTFLGFLDKGEERTVFLSSDEDIFLVKKGDRFGENGRFAVLSITAEELTIRQGDDPRLITIPLVEQAPLAPSF